MPTKSTPKQQTLGERIAELAAERQRTTDELTRLCLLAVSRGASYRDIGKQAGVSYVTIQRWAHPKANNKPTTNPLDEAI